MKSRATSHQSPRARPRRLGAIVVASLAMMVLVGTLAAVTLSSEQQSKAHILDMFGLRGTSSAMFVSEFLGQQAKREQNAARQFLSDRRVSPERFAVVAASFGSEAAVLLDSSGRVLNILPAAPALIGHQIAARYAHLTAAEGGRTAVSNVVPSAARGTPVAAVAVPFATPRERRVFSVAYRVATSALGVFVDHTISYPEHNVFLVDGAGRLLAASPATGATTLAGADPQLALAARHGSRGSIPGARTPSTFTFAQVPGTSWRLYIQVPNSRLYSSISGWAQLVPWLVLVLVSILGVVLVTLFARSIADRSRLTVLSAELERVAQTDALTGLLNRRALTALLARATAHARRRDEPLSVLMIDLDRFKETNDHFGHEAGDQALCAMAECMKDALRAEDIYGRWGGDEFLVGLPSTGEEEAELAAERLRQLTRALDLAEIGLPEGVRFSVGIATAVQTSPAEIVRAADLALYRAKAANHAEMDLDPRLDQRTRR